MTTTAICNRSTDVEEFDGQHETFEIYVICSKAVGSCVHKAVGGVRLSNISFSGQSAGNYIILTRAQQRMAYASSLQHIFQPSNDGEIPDASPQKMPTDDFEQHSSKANDVLKDNAQPPDCSMAAWVNRQS